MKIRPYSKGDFNEIMELWADTEVSRPERGDDETAIERSISLGGVLLVMYDDTAGNKITGTSWLTFDGRRLYLHHFAIIPSYQGKGLSKLLIGETMKIVREKGYQVKLEVHRSNTIALNLYKKAGFKYLGDYDVYINRNI